MGVQNLCQLLPRTIIVLIEKTTLIDLSNDEIVEDSALPGFGIMAAGASLLFVSRRFRS